jgi:hypothetical protein
MIPRALKLCIVPGAVLLVASCGGGGGGTLASGGIGGTGISTGTVTAFGSIFVNGVEFDTSDTAFVREGESAIEADFNVGEVVTVFGSFNADDATGVASRVIYDENVNGEVTDTTDAADGRIEVLDQTILVTAATELDNVTALTELAVGNVVEVSGFRNSDGSITATRVARRQINFIPNISTNEVRGFVAGYNPVDMTFRIDNLTVNFSRAAIFEGEVANGRFVEIESSENIVNNVLYVQQLRVERPGPPVQQGERLELQGAVTRFDSRRDFLVDSQRVTTNAATEFEDGEAADLRLNVKVEVNGRIVARDVLLAEEIVFRLPPETFDEPIEGSVLAVNPSRGAVTISNEETGQPRNIVANSRTQFNDDSELELEEFGLADIGTGDELEITGFRRGGAIVAIRIERERSSGGVGGPGSDDGPPNDDVLPPGVPPGDDVLPPGDDVLPPDDGFVPGDDIPPGDDVPPAEDVLPGDGIPSDGTIPPDDAVPLPDVDLPPVDDDGPPVDGLPPDDGATPDDDIPGDDGPPAPDDGDLPPVDNPPPIDDDPPPDTEPPPDVPPPDAEPSPDDPPLDTESSPDVPPLDAEPSPVDPPLDAEPPPNTEPPPQAPPPSPEPPPSGVSAG